MIKTMYLICRDLDALILKADSPHTLVYISGMLCVIDTYPGALIQEVKENIELNINYFVFEQLNTPYADEFKAFRDNLLETLENELVR